MIESICFCGLTFPEIIIAAIVMVCLGILIKGVFGVEV